MAAYFQIKNGYQEGVVIPILPRQLPGFKHPVFIIGTDPRCDLVLHDAEVAPVHAMIALTVEGEYVLKRYKGEIELTVDGERATSIALYAGAYVRIGKTVLCFTKKAPQPPALPVRFTQSKPTAREKRGNLITFVVLVLAIAALPAMLMLNLHPSAVNPVEYTRVDSGDVQYVGSDAMMVANPGKIALLSFDRDT
jgi:pSer/pThr/pTyr-binding forkhead associated (FHA) protein